MKAKEYADLLLKSEDKKTEIQKIMFSFLKEVVDIANMRKAKSDSALFSILREQEQKFLAFARIINSQEKCEIGINPEGFTNLLKIHMPDIYAKYEIYKLEKNFV